MRLTATLMAGAAWGWALTACTAGSVAGRSNDASLLHSDSGIGVGQTYEDIIQTFKAYAAQHQDLTQILTYGTSGQGRPLIIMKIQDQTAKANGLRPAVLISEAIHGNEYLDIADRLPREFIDGTGTNGGFKQLLAAGGVVYVVPLANPDGFDARQRENAAGVDLNRDFTIKAAGNSGFTQPETSQVTRYMASEIQQNQLSLEASLEYHCCIGGLIHPWNYDVDRQLTGDMLTRHQEVGDEVRTLFGYPSGNVRDVVNYQDGAVGGSDDYYLETYGRRAFSFEGAERTEAANLAQHVQMWDYIFQRVLAERGGASSDLYLAIASEQTDGLYVEGAAADSYDTLDVCVGDQPTCAGAGAQHIATTIARAASGRRYFTAQRGVPAAAEVLTLTASSSANGASAQLAVQIAAGP